MNINPSPQLEKLNPKEASGGITDGQREWIRTLIIIAAGLLLTLAIASQLISPFRAHSWLIFALGICAILLIDGLLVWIVLLYREKAATSKRYKNLRKQWIDQNRDLKLSFEERTASLKRQLDQNRIAIEISRIISQNLDPQYLLEQVVTLTQERFNLYYSGVFLVDLQKPIAVLQAGSGDAGKKMLARHHSLQIDETSMIGWSIAHKEPRISLDVGTEVIRFKNPDLPLTRSEIALPLINHETLLGALTFQSKEPDAFNPEDIVTLQGVADVIATALENSRLIQETRRNLNEINSLHQKYLETAWTEEIKNQPDLQFIFEAPGDTQKPPSNISIPMALRGQTIGTLNLEMDRDEITPDEMALIEAITNQTALALENARLLEETQKKVGQEQMLNELTTRFSRALDVDQILRIALKELGNLPQVSEVSVYIKSPESDDLDRLSVSERGQNGRS